MFFASSELDAAWVIDEISKEEEYVNAYEDSAEDVESSDPRLTVKNWASNAEPADAELAVDKRETVAEQPGDGVAGDDGASAPGGDEGDVDHRRTTATASAAQCDAESGHSEKTGKNLSFASGAAPGRVEGESADVHSKEAETSPPDDPLERRTNTTSLLVQTTTSDDEGEDRVGRSNDAPAFVDDVPSFTDPSDVDSTHLRQSDRARQEPTATAEDHDGAVVPPAEETKPPLVPERGPAVVELAAEQGLRPALVVANCSPAEETAEEPRYHRTTLEQLFQLLWRLDLPRAFKYGKKHLNYTSTEELQDLARIYAKYWQDDDLLLLPADQAVGGAVKPPGGPTAAVSASPFGGSPPLAKKDKLQQQQLLQQQQQQVLAEQRAKGPTGSVLIALLARRRVLTKSDGEVLMENMWSGV